jgi:hypothetical protein
MSAEGPCAICLEESDDLTCAVCVEETVADAVRAEREACAAYCLDRADQYETKSPIWVGIANCAEGIAKGEASESLRTGETEDLLKRVRQLAGFTRFTPKPREKVRTRTPLTRDKIG